MTRNPVIEFPLSAQKCSTLKKHLKINCCSAEIFLKETLPIALKSGHYRNKQQLNYMVQLSFSSMICLNNFEIGNRVVAHLLSYSLFTESYGFIIVQCSILNETIGNIKSISKTPSLKELYEQIPSSSKGNGANSATVCVYLLNCLRIMIGLGLYRDINLTDYLLQKRGLFCWLQRVELASDSSVIGSFYDHTFKLLYGVISSKEYLKTEDSCLLAVMTIKAYMKSDKQQQETLDKILCQFGIWIKSSFDGKELQNLTSEKKVTQFYRNIIEILQNSKWENGNTLWLEQALNTSVDNVELLKPLISWIEMKLFNFIILIDHFGALKDIMNDKNVIRCPKTFRSEGSEGLLVDIIIGLVLKGIRKLVDPIFEKKIIKWSSSSPSTDLHVMLNYTKLVISNVKGQQRDAALILNGKLNAILELHPVAINDLIKNQSFTTDLLEKMGYLAFNAGAALSQIESFSSALDHFCTAKDWYGEASKLNDKEEKIQIRFLKSMQGEIQCLMKLGHYEKCIERLYVALKYFISYDVIQAAQRQILKVLIHVYIRIKFQEPVYRPLSEWLDSSRIELIELELEILSDYPKADNFRTIALEHAISIPLSNVQRAEYLLQLASLKSGNATLMCEEVISILQESDGVKCQWIISKAFSQLYLISSGIEAIKSLEKATNTWEWLLESDKRVKIESDIGIEIFFDFSRYICTEACKFGHFKIAANVFVVLSALCELRSNSEKYSDLLDILLQTSYNYMDLGYTGDAGKTLVRAKSILREVPDSGHARFYACYCHYLCSIGNLPKAIETEPKMADYVVDFQIQMTKANIFLEKGMIFKASDNVLRAYGTLIREFKKSPESCIYIWIVRCILLLGRILIMSGNPEQYEYYINQGKVISEKMSSIHYQGIFCAKMAEISVLKGVESSVIIESVKSDFMTRGASGKELATLFLLEGDDCVLNGRMSDAVAAYNFSEKAVDTEMKNGVSLIEKFQEHTIGDQKKSPRRFIPLEILKGAALCRAGSVLVHSGKIPEAEIKLNTVKSLAMTGFERCKYLVELAKLRAFQFFQNYRKSDQAGLFDEAVLAILSKVMPFKNVKKNSLSQKRQIIQLETLLFEAFQSTIRFGDPFSVKQISSNIVSLQLLKTNIYNDTEFLCHAFDNSCFALQQPKSLYDLRRSAENSDLSFIDSASSFLSNSLDRLPDKIIICTIDIDTLRDTIIVTRITKGAKMLFKLPLQRLATREGEINGPGLSFSTAMTEFEEIMRVNKDSTTSARSCTASSQKKQWQRVRRELDQSLCNFLNRLEEEWLAGFKGLLSPSDISDDFAPFLKLQTRIENMFHASISRGFTKKCQKVQIDMDICKLIAYLGSAPSFEQLEDVIYFILDSYQIRGFPIEYDEVNIEDLRDDLKAIIQLYHKESLGNDFSDNHIVIIPDWQTQHLPWESLPILRNSPVSRLPSLGMLRECLERNQEIDASNTRYALNPSGDLGRTETQMRPLLQDWEGIIGRSPSKKEYLALVEDSSLFLYFGHGGGEAYIDIQTISKLQNSPPVFLFGCSSGYLKPARNFEPSGIALEYLKAGRYVVKLFNNSSIVLGNLWDITDIDIDRYAKQLLSSFSEGCSGVSIVDAANKARNACNLKYIVGSAPVVYGLPALIKF